jgi:hypothetical protein
MHGVFEEAQLPPAQRRAEDGGQGRRRAAESTLALPASPEGIFDFEDFVDGVAFLEPAERARMKLAGGEIYDNLVRHALPLENNLITVRATRHGRKLFLAFYFKSKVFAPYAACSDCGRAGPDTAFELAAADPALAAVEAVPFFDPLIGRWRGIGIRMCRYLSESLLLRAGSRLDRVYIAF